MPSEDILWKNKYLGRLHWHWKSIIIIGQYGILLSLNSRDLKRICDVDAILGTYYDYCLGLGLWRLARKKNK